MPVFRHLTRLDAPAEETFAWHERKGAFEQSRLKIAMTGAAGLIGSALSALLSSGGHDVRPMVRREANIQNGEVHWGPDERFDTEPLEGLDALVHLAGESISTSRWTKDFKERIRHSRVSGTRAIAEALASLERPPKVLICASAVGFYGDRGDEEITESSARGKGFLADVCSAWEEAAEPARSKGIRVVHLRLGVVLAAKGGALPRMIAPFRFGFGGKIGNGRQWMSWISLGDAVGAFHAALIDKRLEGAVNAVAPNSVTNRNFTKALAKVLHRPAVVPLPAFAVKLSLGEMGRALLLDSCRALPARLLETGFRFLAPTIEEALSAELGKNC